MLLTDNACDRSTAYHMSNKIVRRDDGLYVTWIDSEYRNIIAKVDPDTPAVEGAVPIAQGFDNHCGAAMALTADGVLHVVSGSHHAGFVYRASDEPMDPASWSLPECPAGGATYPSLVAHPDGALHLAYRHYPRDGVGHWGMGWAVKDPGQPWSRCSLLARAPAPGYIYPTNALAVGPDDTLHCIVEWYKTYPDSVEPPRTMAVGHLELPAGATGWLHTDGRPVSRMPVGLEDTSPVIFRADANLRPSNVAVLPDGRPCFTMWNRVTSGLLLAVRQADRSWAILDITERLNALSPGTQCNGQAQTTALPDGTIVLAAQRAEDPEWAHPTTGVHVAWVNADSGDIERHMAVPKAEPDEPDWLPCVEKGIRGALPESPYLMYQTGRRGVGCVNDATCRVRLLQLD